MHRLILATASLALLAGCNVGSSTYGTGRTQEAQLVSDLANVVSFKRQKRAPIDYSERPELVKPGNTASLPAPIEQNTSSSAFPGSADQVALKGEKPRVVRRGELDQTLSAEDRKYMNWKGPMTKGYREWVSKRVKKAKASKALASNSDGNRRYLTEPPNKYRKTYDTAPVGETGVAEDTKDFRKKSKGNIFSKLLGRG